MMMKLPEMYLTLPNGEVATVKLAKPRIWIELEKRARKRGESVDTVGIEDMMFGAWIALGRPDKFDEWVDSIEEMQLSDEGEDLPVPSQPEPSDGS